MQEFLKILMFALTLTFMIVTLSVALWNEGCNQKAIPHPVKYAGRNPEESENKNAGFPMLNNDREVIVLPQF